jgi:outer membrane protein OmpA-like peptidoglycan-associated protein
MATSTSSSELTSSLTDLMTSLAVIFILLLVASINNIQKQAGVSVSQILQALRARLDEYVTKDGVQVKSDPRDPLGLLVLVPEGLLQFEKNKADIPPKGVDFLARFSPILVGTTCDRQFRSDIHSIVVEGHADSSGTESINLPLSQARSMAVVSQTLGVLMERDPTGDLKHCFLQFVSATGRGSEDPVLDANNVEDPERSRRVVFKIRVRSVEQRDLLQKLQ